MLERPNDDSFLNEEPPTEDPAKRIRFLAKALAWGAFHNRWSSSFYVRPRFNYVQGSMNEAIPTDYLGQEWIAAGYGDASKNLENYLKQKWHSDLPQIELLETSGYLEKRGTVKIASVAEMSNRSPEYALTEKALSLLDEPRYKSIFISYKRSESSAFALLFYDRLIGAGYKPFLDKRGIMPGEDWKKRLTHEIEVCDVFICLIGRETLKSVNVLYEIEAALSRKDQHADFPVIPIWHNSLERYKDELPEFWKAEFPERNQLHLSYLLTDSNAISVEQENVLGYQNAWDQLFQYLGTSS